MTEIEVLVPNFPLSHNFLTSSTGISYNLTSPVIEAFPETSNGDTGVIVETPNLPLTPTTIGYSSPVVVPLSILNTLPEPAVDLILSASPDAVTTSSFANEAPVVPKPTEPVATSRAAPPPD